MDYTTEKTPTGMQYVIPGAERIVKPRRRAFKLDSDQLAIPGAEQTSAKRYLPRLKSQPLTPRLGQVGLQGTTWFGRQRLKGRV